MPREESSEISQDEYNRQLAAVMKDFLGAINVLKGNDFVPEESDKSTINAAFIEALESVSDEDKRIINAQFSLVMGYRNKIEKMKKKYSQFGNAEDQEKCMDEIVILTGKFEEDTRKNLSQEVSKWTKLFDVSLKVAGVLLGGVIGAMIGLAAGVAIGAGVGSVIPVFGNIGGAIAAGSMAGVVGAIQGAGIGVAIASAAGVLLLGWAASLGLKSKPQSPSDLARNGIFSNVQESTDIFIEIGRGVFDRKTPRPGPGTEE